MVNGLRGRGGGSAVAVPEPSRGPYGGDDEEGRAAIVQQPDKHKQPIGEIKEILGKHMSADLAVNIAIRSHEIPCEWPDEVNKEIKRYTAEVGESDKRGRRECL